MTTPSHPADPEANNLPTVDRLAEEDAMKRYDVPARDTEAKPDDTCCNLTPSPQHNAQPSLEFSSNPHDHGMKPTGGVSGMPGMATWSPAPSLAPGSAGTQTPETDHSEFIVKAGASISPVVDWPVVHSDLARRLETHRNALRGQVERLLNELNWMANTLSVFSANVPADADIDRRYIAGRLSSCHELGAKKRECRPYEDNHMVADLRQQLADANAALEEAKRDLAIASANSRRNGETAESLMNDLHSANAALEEARRERDDANKIKSAEKLILLKEIEGHAATKAQLDAAKKAGEEDRQRLQKMLAELRAIRASHSEIGGRIAAAIGEAMDK